MYEVIYYKKLNSGWRKGRVRNLSWSQCIYWYYIIADLLDTKLVLLRKMRSNND